MRFLTKHMRSLLVLALGVMAVGCSESECRGVEMMGGDACLLSDSEELCPASAPERYEGPNGVLCTAPDRDRDDFTDRECNALGFASGCGFVVLGECAERRRLCFACGTDISPNATCTDGNWSCPSGFGIEEPNCADCQEGANNVASAPLCSSCDSGTEVLATCQAGSWECAPGLAPHSECSSFVSEGGLCEQSEDCVDGMFCHRPPGCVAMGRCTSSARMSTQLCAMWRANNTPLPRGPNSHSAPDGAYCTCASGSAILNASGCPELPMRQLGQCRSGANRGDDSDNPGNPFSPCGFGPCDENAPTPGMP